MDWITTSGRTLHEAKSNALDQLGIVADDAEFDVINDVEKGLFGRVKTEAKIRRIKGQIRQTKTRLRELKSRGGDDDEKESNKAMIKVYENVLGVQFRRPED